MATTIITKNSSTASSVPTAAQLVQGELAVNVADKRIFTEDNTGTVVELGTNPSALTVNGVLTASAGSASAPAITTSGDTNTGIFFPAADTIAFSEGGTEAMRLDSSGNLGLGVTPSAWGGGFNAIEVKYKGASFASNGTNNTIVASNWFYDGADKYAHSTYATQYAQYAGAHYWKTAPSGTAGNAITFTQAMTLDASGNLGIGTSSPTLYFSSSNRGLSIGGTSNGAEIDLKRSGSSNTCYIVQDVADNFTIGTSGANAVRLYTNDTERMRIDSSGNLLVGTTNTDPIASSTNGLAYALDNTVLRLMTSSTALALGSSNNSEIQQFYRSSKVGSISVTASATAYNTSSDYRLKDNQAPLTGSGAFIDALQPKTWTWKVDGSTGVGFIAHEVQEVSPNSVMGEKDAVDEEGKPVMQAMEYGSAEFIANIVAELQDLRKRVSALENK